MPVENPLVSGAPREVIADAGNTVVKLGINLTRLPEKIIKVERLKWRGGLAYPPQKQSVVFFK